MAGNQMINSQPLFGKAEEAVMPSMVPSKAKENPLDGYVFRIYKGCIGEAGDILFLEDLYTKAMTGSGEVVIYDRSSWTFQDQMYVVVTYAEKTES